MMTTFKMALSRVNSRSWLARSLNLFLKHRGLLIHTRQQKSQTLFYRRFPARFAQDTFSAYKVMRKLGYRQCSTVWLASSHDSFKREILERLSDIAGENGGRHFMLRLQGQFKHRGPNGQHVCLVFDAQNMKMGQCGKNYSTTAFTRVRFPPWRSKTHQYTTRAGASVVLRARLQSTGSKHDEDA